MCIRDRDATFDDYRAFLEDYTPDKVAKLCNIPDVYKRQLFHSSLR